MKRIFPLLMVATMLMACFFGCSKSTQISDLSRTSYIEVRAFSMTDQSYTDYVISDYEIVDEICATFSDLTLKKVNNTEPLAVLYQLCFFDHSHRRINSFLLISGNMIDYDGNLYNVQNSFDVKAYVDGAIANQPPVE